MELKPDGPYVHYELSLHEQRVINGWLDEPILQGHVWNAMTRETQRDDNITLRSMVEPEIAMRYALNAAFLKGYTEACRDILRRYDHAESA